MNNCKSKSKICHICIIVFLSLFLAVSAYTAGCTQKKPTQTYAPKVLVLDDCDSDNDTETPPRGDKVLMLDSNGELLNTINGFKIKTRFGENKVISVSEDGRFFAVCENADNKLTIIETSTGQEYWSATWPSKAINTAVFCNNILYAANPNVVLALDINKKSITEIEGLWDGTWFDFAFDKQNNCIWAGGMNIRKYDMDFKTILNVNSIFDTSIAGVFSIDITSDGSAWAAVKEAAEKNGLENMLVKISPDGNVIKTIKLDIGPFCICVDKSDDSIWVTGMSSGKDYSKIGDEWPETLTELYEKIETDVKTFTHKYNSQGDRIVELGKGGYSMDIDPADKSVWIAGRDSIIHSSSTGDIISEYNNVSKQHKWIAVIK